MLVGVGFSDEPDTASCARAAAVKAVQEAGRNAPCDLVLLFATARHDGEIIRKVVASVVGEGVPIVGGGAVGTMVNDRFGYGGDQLALAVIWLENTTVKLVCQDRLHEGEREAGEKLGRKLAETGLSPDAPVLFFYDAIDRTGGGIRMVTATMLLEGIKKGLGFLPAISGGGLQGDYICTPTRQLTGQGVSGQNAMALVFGGDVRMDCTIIHGCRPVTGYYTVTRADGQILLEINGVPALGFMEELLGKAVPPEQWPFFLFFGVNRGRSKWDDLKEENYVNRPCVAIDRKRNGIVMSEPDMVAGTEFQVMYRSLDLDYMAPRIEALFQGLGGRKPVFALYVDCAGRAAAQAGIELEDALVVQQCVAARVPLLGLYTGVEIAPVRGEPCGLGLTGVFCLFSISGDM
ncbi:FIST C-terminal domain-containing protein [Desulfovibrio sp. OttesenSCG-928-G15]|nr:FIST C-terminal domain-containing protein [Desulfovibrio sp. OttesenSCG-928-G15]